MTMKKLQLVLLVLAALLLTSCKTLENPVDCRVIHHQNHDLGSGVYTIQPRSHGKPFKVFCDMKSFGGGWTVFQRRLDGSLNFYRPWDQYTLGFGTAEGEYWLGLDHIYRLTKHRRHELLVKMEDFEGKKVFARYSTFSVSGDCDGYRLTVSGFTNGGAGDALTYHNGQKFSTYDKDQDSSGSNCARINQGGFWYNNCHYANPNGIYSWGADGSISYTGIIWYPWLGWNYSLKSISMMIRPAH